ncbi:DUF3618 domain-containing protein [Micromonospora musae]|uniref:DUF3618 domain-containing protein n=1 Tax=Micromonospora musae TaxID=1894970 RepID=UPI0033D0C22E
MSTDADRIRQQIEHTRRDLSDNIDALADKVSPRRIAGDRVGEARGALTRMKEKVMGSSAQMGDGAGSRMSSATGSVQQMGQQAGQRMSSAAGSMRDEARSVGQQSREQMHGNPVAAGLIAFGAGLLVSALLPASRRERQLAGQARGMMSQQVGQHAGELREQAGQFGHQFRDNMRQPARQAAQSVGSTAIRGAGAVREQGRSAAHQMRGQAQEAAGELRR